MIQPMAVDIQVQSNDVREERSERIWLSVEHLLGMQTVSGSIPLQLKA